MSAMNDLEKEQQMKSVEKRYKNRKGFKRLSGQAQRELYRKDMLQPHQHEFRDVFKKQHLIREATDRSVEREEAQKAKELDDMYRAKPRNVVTSEEKTLKELHNEHPNMVSEEEIIRCK